MAESDLLSSCRLGGSALDAKLVKELVAASPQDVNVVDESQWTPAMWCTRNGACDALEALCHAGADVNAADRFRNQALHLAARDGRADAVAVLLRAGAHANSKTEDGLTAMMMAAKNGHVDALKALLAGPHAPDVPLPAPAAAPAPAPPAPAAPAEPPATAAPAEGLVGDDAAAGEAPGGADDVAPDATAAQEVAAAPAVVESLAPPYQPAGPLRLEEKDAAGQTALLWACLRDKADAVACLAAAGAAVDARDPEGRTGLIVAAGLGSVDVLQALLNAGASLTAQGEDGKTAAIAAAKEGRAEALSVLVSAGASVMRPADAAGNTPLSLSGGKVLKAVLDADPSRLFLDNRNYLGCFKASVTSVVAPWGIPGANAAADCLTGLSLRGKAPPADAEDDAE